MLAASSGNTDAVQALLDRGADANATESANGQTALMFAAAADRAEAVRAAAAARRQAALSPRRSSTSPASSRPKTSCSRRSATRRTRSRRKAGGSGTARRGGGQRAPCARHAGRRTRPPASRAPFTYNELIGKQGGLTALHFAARQGALQTVKALVEAGADVNQVSPADATSPLLIATINGHFDLAKYAARPRRRSESRERRRHDAALRGAERRVGAEDVLPAAARLPAAAARPISI